MKKRLHILLLLFFVTYSYSQNEPIIYPSFIGQDFTSIQKNKDWIILDQVSGHLDDDPKKDMALVLESKDYVNEKRCDDCDISKSKARIVLLLLNIKGKQVVCTQNNTFIPRADEGGMDKNINPLLIIENNEFIIFQQYLRGFSSYTFKLQNNDLYIVSARVSGVSGDKFESNVYDFIKETATKRSGHISSNEEDVKTTTIQFKVKSKTLSEFKEMHSWKIAEYFYL